MYMYAVHTVLFRIMHVQYTCTCALYKYILCAKVCGARSCVELFTESTSIILVLYINYAFYSENVETRKSSTNDRRYEQEFKTKLLSYVVAEST